MRNANKSAIALGIWVAVAGLGCSKSHESKPTPVPSAPALAISVPEHKTTAPDIAIGNLDAQIAGLTKAADGDVSRMRGVVDLLLSRAQFLGSYSDWDAVDKLTADFVKSAPANPDAHVARASFLETVHKFEAAKAELDAAAANAPATMRASILMAEGRYDDAVALNAFPEEGPPLLVTSNAMLASYTHRDADARRLFDVAIGGYHDVSPFAVAWMEFQRATAFEDRGDSANAKRWFTAAHTALPQFTHAAVHLATLSTPAEAAAMLRPLSGKTGDADVDAGLADALRRLHEPGDVDAALRAKTQFEALLIKWPEAFWDHAAAFYLGLGANPARALDLAQKNAALRNTEKAVELWLTAALAAKGDACTPARAAKALRYKSSRIEPLIASGSAQCAPR